jgi:hypothetical protein
MPKSDPIPKTDPAEIERLIERLRQSNLEQRDLELVERLLQTALSLVRLLQQKNTSIKKLREMIFGKRTERHQTGKAEGQQKSAESEKAEDCRPKAVDDQDVRPELRSIESGEKTKRKGHGRRASEVACGLVRGTWPDFGLRLYAT